MTLILKKNIELIILTVIGIAVYTLIFLNLNIDVSNAIAFSTVDSKSYLDVANWLGSGIDSQSVSTRPILYPLILLIATKIGGVYGIWMFQVIFWILSLNFIFLAIKKLTRSSISAFIGAFVFMSNLSVIALTFHALTEVTTIFLLSMLIYFLAKNLKRFREPKFLHICLFFLVLLTLVKPTFSIPLYGTLFIIFPVFYFKKHLKDSKHFFKLFLILLPLLIQLTIIKTKYDQFSVSTIGPKTITNYIVAKGVQKIESENREGSINIANSFSRDEQLDYIFEHFSVYKKLFWRNLRDNIDGNPTYLLYPAGYENQKLANLMRSYNTMTMRLHKVFIFPFLLLLVILLRRQEYPQLFLLGFLYLLGLYYILVTGISFWQGDRLTLPAIAIWSCLYPSILFYYLKLLNPRKYFLRREVRNEFMKVMR